MTLAELMNPNNKTRVSRDEAAARLHVIANELATSDAIVIARDDMRFVAHVPDQVELNVEFAVAAEGSELRIELGW